MRWEKLTVNARLRETPERKKGRDRNGEVLGPGKRWGHTCNSVQGGKFVYVFGGYSKDTTQTNDVHVFDTTRQVWSKPMMKGTPPSPRDSHSCTTVGNKLFVFGGTNGTDPLQDLFILDTTSNTWISPSLHGEAPEAREGHGAALIGKQLFIFGGSGKSQNKLDDVYYNDLYILDTETLEWRHSITSGTSPSARDSHACSAWKHNIVVVAGVDTSGHYLSDIHILDTDTLVWEELYTSGQRLPPRAGHSSVTLGRNLFVLGGFTDNRNLFDDLHMLNLETGIWTKVTAVGDSPTAIFSAAGDCLDAQKGVLVFIGGCNAHLEALDDMYYLHTGISVENVQGELRTEKSSLRKEMKRKCLEQCHSVRLPVTDVHNLGIVPEMSKTVVSPSSGHAGDLATNVSQSESSKQATKQARREILSVQAAINDSPHTEVHILEEHSNELTYDNPTESSKDTPSHSTAEPRKSKNTRGPTKCNLVETENGRKIEVEFNDRGQPIGKSSEIFSSYVGHLGREMLPIIYNDWRKVPNVTKERLWESITEKFTFVGGEGKSYTLQLVGRLWRAYKARLGANVEKKPKNIDSTEWETFVKQRSTEKFMEKSKKFKDMRSKQDVPYTGSRMGYARMEEKMKKECTNPSSITRVDVWCRAHTKKSGKASNKKAAKFMKKVQELRASHSSQSSSRSIRDDALSQLLGPERQGRVRGLGSGIPPSKLGVVSQSTGKVAKLEEEVASMKEKMDQMCTLIVGQNKMIDTLLNNQGQQRSEQMMQSTTTTTQLQCAIINRKCIKCKLINWMVPDEVVAIGRWVSNDPNTMVHGIALGNKASRVWVDEIEQPSALLWRSTTDMETIEEAQGSSVAWPTDHLIMQDD